MICDLCSGESAEVEYATCRYCGVHFCDECGDLCACTCGDCMDNDAPDCGPEPDMEYDPAAHFQECRRTEPSTILKRCPFCGGDDVAVVVGDNGERFGYCRECRARGPVVFASGKQLWASDGWNRRYSGADARDTTERSA